MDGISLLHPVDREYLHGEHTLGEDSMHFILTKEDKYIWYSQTGRELYFNLRDDPHETKMYWTKTRSVWPNCVPC